MPTPIPRRRVDDKRCLARSGLPARQCGAHAQSCGISASPGEGLVQVFIDLFEKAHRRQPALIGANQ
jgi:hypothetical protein